MKIALTGAAGFIGSCLLWKLNEQGYDTIFTVDRLDTTDKWRNLVGKRFADYFDADDFIDMVEEGVFDDLDVIIHMGACTSTTLDDSYYYMKNNYEYTKRLAIFAEKKNVRFLYASSAATYGDGSRGFSDDDAATPELQPLNMYGYSKHLFDLWVLHNNLQKKFTGFKFFNVFGPNEYHKGDMMSLICKRFESVRRDKKIGLFKSCRNDYGDGEQKRDFIYVKDAVKIVDFFMQNPDKTGIYNVGTGRAHSWNDVARGMFAVLDLPVNIEYIEMPEALKDKYQYFTEADTTKLRAAGCTPDFYPLEDAIREYTEYLKNRSCL